MSELTHGRSYALRYGHVCRYSLNGVHHKERIPIDVSVNAKLKCFFFG